MILKFEFFQQAGMMSGQKPILGWIKDIVNHFWFACQHASNREEFMVSMIIQSVWNSIVKYCSNRCQFCLYYYIIEVLGCLCKRHLCILGCVARCTPPCQWSTWMGPWQMPPWAFGWWKRGHTPWIYSTYGSVTNCAQPQMAEGYWEVSHLPVRLFIL